MRTAPSAKISSLSERPARVEINTGERVTPKRRKWHRLRLRFNSRIIALFPRRIENDLFGSSREYMPYRGMIFFVGYNQKYHQQSNGSKTVALRGDPVSIGCVIQADFVVASSRPQAERLKDHLLVAEVMLKNNNLQKGDQITQIDGQDVDGMKFEDASDLLNGQEGTTVKVTVKRNGFSSLLTLEVRRVNPILNKDGTPAI